MEPGLGSNSAPFDKSRVLNVKPLRCVPPPNNNGSGYSQFYPSNPNNDHSTQTSSKSSDGGTGGGGHNGLPKRNLKTHSGDSGISTSEEQEIDRGGVSSNGSKQKNKVKSKKPKMSENEILNSQDGDTDLVASILMKYDGLRRRFAQLEEAGAGVSKRPDLKAGTIMMNNSFRTNLRKRIGNVPGIEVGDIFFFRIELCLVGLHCPIMAGIDYMVMNFSQVGEPLAVSIVSSGGYEDEADAGDVLIYSGQGGNLSKKKDNGKEASDQKLERGNLALEKSLHRGNEVRVIRGVKDVLSSSGKVYIYDGLYKIQESWTEKNKVGVSVFKYKLVRVLDQPEAFTLWKATQQWKENINYRHGLVLPDLSLGVEKLPIPLVNDVDGDRGPAHFVYIPSLKYPERPSVGCGCTNYSCLPNSDCSCIQKNGGDSPYANGLLVIQKPLIHECGPSCSCYPTCKNQVAENGPKVRLEVFKTENRGWGVRSWDPIRAGTFICEYAGDVINNTGGRGVDIDNDYIFNAIHPGNYIREWNYIPELLGEKKPVDLNEAYKPKLPMTISSKNMGNVARFLNHSCSPNIFWQLVSRDKKGDSYPHILFFAIKHIPPMTELTYDYGTSDGRRKPCLCGTSKCRSYFG